MQSKDLVIHMKWDGETGKIKEEALKFINFKMNGLDIGNGGSPIMIQAIGIDKKCPSEYSDCVQLKGDASKLYWFTDECMDYVYSSHCYEDVPPEKKLAVLKEWVRVLKHGGLLLLYLPIEQEYVAYTKRRGEGHNLDHKDPNFNIETVREIAKKITNIKEIYAIEKHGDYCFFIIFRKV